ncbi:HD domain-containing phosphohydrolase [Lignipirellula cremea]|nr:HD domain-containing phosphohydrolase [Lignipirellula cremea]
MTVANRHQYRTLIVDDQDAIHDDFQRILCGEIFRGRPLDAFKAEVLGAVQSAPPLPEFTLDSAHQGKEGLLAVQQARAQGNPYALAFVDVRMPPGWDGIETAQHLLEADEDLQIVLCTAYSDYSISEILEKFQGVNRVLLVKKPFDAAEISLMAVSLSEKWRLTRETRQLIRSQASHITDTQRVMKIVQSCHDELAMTHHELQDHAEFLAVRLQERTVELLGTRDVTMFALAQLAESRDPETGEHLRRMQAYAQRLADHLAIYGEYRGLIDKSWLDDFYRSTPLHDIGKVGIPDHILLKPERLTPAEFEVMKRHALIGAEALERAAHHGSGGFLTMAADIARHHHERWDGKGYPYGLKELEIPLSARVTSVADVFDALTSARVYKDAMSAEQARDIIVEGRTTQFDPAIVDAFLACYVDFLDIKETIDGEEPFIQPLPSAVKPDFGQMGLFASPASVT